MDGGHRFVIVEYPMPDTPLSGFTARHPGCTIDLISEPPVDAGAERLHPSVVLVKGAPKPELDRLLERLQDVYDHVETIERDDVRGFWMGRMRLRESAYVHSPGARVVTQFQHRYGAPWTHLEHGLVHLRAKVNDPAQGELLADQMRRFFDKEGVEAQVEVREISAKDYGVWEDLVQRSIGLAS